MSLLKAVGILGTGAYVPEQILTNQDLESMVDTSDEWITSRTGIKERRIAKKEEAASDLARRAAEGALLQSGLTPSELELIIVATVTPDMAFPATACIVQQHLGAKNAAAFDLSAGCSGFLYALEVATNMIKGGYKNALVIGVDVLSRITDYTDRATGVLFGDGAGAAVLGHVREGFGFLASWIGADGTGGPFLQLPAGGSRLPASLETIKERQHYIHMSGNEVFKFAVRIMGHATQFILERANITGDAVRFLIPHQANTRIIQAAASRVSIPPERVFTNVEKYGNTSAGSVGIALHECIEQNKVVEGDILVLVGFGAGLTWGATVLRFGGAKLG